MPFLKRFQTSLESLYQLPDKAKYVIAYSGGLDSHVLLHCCHKLKLPIRAVHVHHGLQNIADDWVEHCQAICKTLNIHLDVIYVEVKKKRGLSPEEAARNARYAALKKNLQVADCLLTAQHLNDQAETLLLQLFRTASSAGLSAMPSCRQLAHNVHLRPLLLFSRKEIENFARENVLHWIEDPSNQDVSFDRNFIRKNVIPGLEDRWPEIATQLSTVASLQSNNLQVLEDMAAIDLANAVTTSEYKTKIHIDEIVSVVSISALKRLSSARLLNVLRYWLIQTTEIHSPADLMEKISPTRKLLNEIERALIYSQLDANPVINFSGFELKKFKHDLYLLKPELKISNLNKLDWNPSLPLTIPSLNVQIKSIDTTGDGLKHTLLNGPLTVCFRQGGEHFHPVGRQHSQSLKKLFQQANIPPWERGSIPLLYCGDELIAVIGLWLSKQHVVNENEQGWMIDIKML